MQLHPHLLNAFHKVDRVRPCLNVKSLCTTFHRYMRVFNLFALLVCCDLFAARLQTHYNTSMVLIRLLKFRFFLLNFCRTRFLAKTRLLVQATAARYRLLSLHRWLSSAYYGSHFCSLALHLQSVCLVLMSPCVHLQPDENCEYFVSGLPCGSFACCP